MPLYVSPELGRVSGAICYDYDFPRLGLEHAALDVDLVALPSSDWRGIDPIHTEMAAVRAIEGGHSVVRSTRFGLSAGIDPYGRMRGTLSHFDGTERVLVTSLPRHGVRTVYGAIGDMFPISCVVFGLGALLVAWIRRTRWYAARSSWTPSSPSRAEPSSRPART
jgi:apolipoprotein N-acyltransferase